MSLGTDMPLAPSDWSVVVLGGWNRAILTPLGIAARLFSLPLGNEVSVEAPMDALGPFRVSYSGLVVMVTNALLVVETRVSDSSHLERAMAAAHKAMECLPETPLTASGYNVRYRGNDQDPLVKPLLDATVLKWDDTFPENDYPIARRDITWAADWRDGRISTNLVRERDGTLELNLNFERRGDRAALMAWLARPVAEIRTQVDYLFTTVLGLTREAWE